MSTSIIRIDAAAEFNPATIWFTHIISQELITVFYPRKFILTNGLNHSGEVSSYSWFHMEGES